MHSFTADLTCVVSCSQCHLQQGVCTVRSCRLCHGKALSCCQTPQGMQTMCDGSMHCVYHGAR